MGRLNNNSYRLGGHLLALLGLAMAAASAYAAEGDIYTLQKDSSLRQGPDSYYAPTSSAIKGGQAIELNSSGEWKKVRMFVSGDVGWVYANSLVPVAADSKKTKVVQASPVATNVKGNSLDESVRAADAAVALTEFASLRSEVLEKQPERLAVQVEPVVQSMAPSKESVEGESVPPLFEDGAVSLEPVEVEQVKNKLATNFLGNSKPEAIETKTVRHPLKGAKLNGTGLKQFPVQFSTSQAAQNKAAQPVIEKTPAVEAAAYPVKAKEVAEDVKPAAAVVIDNNESGKPLTAQPSSYGSQLVKQTAVIRVGPSALSEVLGWAGTGAQVQTIHQQGKWMKVRLLDSGRIGWVESTALGLSSTTASVPLVRKQQSIPMEEKEPQLEVVNILTKQAPPQRSEAVEGVEDTARLEPVTKQSAILNETITPQWEVKNVVATPEKALEKLESKAIETAASQQEVINVVAEPETALDKLEGKSVVVAAEMIKHEIRPIETAASQPEVKNALAKSASKLEKSESQQADVVAPVEMAKQQNRLLERAAPQEGTSTVIAKQSSGLETVILAPDATMVIESQSAQNSIANTESPEKSLYKFNRKSKLRADPNSKSGTVSWAGEGAKAIELDRNGDWVRIQMQVSKRIGWVYDRSLDIVTLGVSAAGTSVAAAGVSPSPIVMPIKTGGQSAQESAAPSDEETIEVAQAEAKMEAAQSEAKAEAVQAEASNETVATKRDLYRFNEKTNLRSGPAEQYEIVSWAGSEAYASELARNGDWAQVQLKASKRIGWVLHSSLALVKTAINSSEAGAVGADSELKEIAEDTGPKLYFFKRTSNLRAGPGKEFDRIAWGGRNEAAEEIERKGGWQHVRMTLNGQVGWVFNEYLERAVHPGHLMGLPPLPVAAEPVELVVKKVELEKGKAEDVKAEKVAEDTGSKLYFFKRTSNLRAGPGKEFDRIAWGGRNEAAEEIERKGDWQHVRMSLNGQVGWVFNEYLVRAVHPGHLMGAPALAISAPAKKVQQQKTGQMYEVMRTEPLRADAGDFSELIGSVQKGDVVAWLEGRSGWARVNPQIDGSKVGWIQANLLKQRKLAKVEQTQAVISNTNIMEYSGRISKGETFNFSYAALEEALYRIPVEEIHIRLREDDMDAIFLKRQFDQSSFEIRLTAGRHRLKGTLKVLGSSTRIFKKKSIMIKLDKQSARWYGHRRIALRSMASDKALMREWMAWKMMAALGMKVPEVHFTRVTFNKGEKTALYLSVEWMGREFLEGNNLDTRGEFYQPNDGAHCGDLYTPDGMDLCFDKITPQDKDYSSLIAMAKAVNLATNENIDQVLAKYFEDESIINWIAVNGLVTNGDTYNKNYWLYYHPTEKKWTVVPWDYNLTYGRTYDQYSTKAFRIFNDNFQYYYPPDVGAGNPVKDKALRNPKLRTRLENKIKHLIGMEPNGAERTFGWFSPTVMQARIGNLASVVGKEVYKDTFLSYGEADFTKTYESLIHYVTAHDHFLKVKLFGDFPWEPEPPNQPFMFMPMPDTLIGEGEIAAGAESLHLVDRGWGYFVGRLNLTEPLKSKVDFKVQIEGGIKPKYIPASQSWMRCIERSWLLSTKTENVSVSGDFMVEYVQENSRRSEVPPQVHEELLELWMLDGNRWKPLQTEVNEYSNTLTAKNIDMESGHTYRFVACSPF